VLEEVAEKPNFVGTAKERASANGRGQTIDPTTVFDEADLDIPAFIREHRQR
jgi:hypothetical protein